jgi:uncharacterized DUF497 family protein
MQFEWDEAKSERNRPLRGLPFGLAIPLFEGLVVERLDARRDDGEIRMCAVGEVGGLYLACVYLRRANRRERHGYRESQFGRY